MALKKIELSTSEKKNIIKSMICREESDFSKLCLFSHFDRDDKIDRYVVFMIKSLFELGFDIVFVTTSERIESDELSKISNYLKKMIVKKNIGYDFISWKTGLSEVDNYSKYKMILHINDSIFFPLNDPSVMFTVMAKKNVDFWGICDSFTFKHHVESFFWVFNEKIINSDFYNIFWNECKTIHSKTDLIKTYEVEFTSLVKENNFKVSSYISMQKLLDYGSINFNKYNYHSLYQSTPFHSFWEVMIEKFNSPFIKKNILCYGHKDYNIGTEHWRECIRKYTKYDTSLIEDNINRFKIAHNLENNTTFYKNLNTLFHFIEDIRSKRKILIYGYGVVGKFIHAILKDSVVCIVDSNYNKINNFQKRYGLSPNIVSPKCLDSIKFDEIIICALGREEEIMKELNNIKKSKVINFSSHILGDILKFSNNITSLSKTLRYIHLFNLKKYGKIHLYNPSAIILKYCQEYMKQNNLNPIEGAVDFQSSSELLFVIKSNATENDLLVPFFTD